MDFINITSKKSRYFVGDVSDTQINTEVTLMLPYHMQKTVPGSPSSYVEPESEAIGVEQLMGASATS